MHKTCLNRKEIGLSLSILRGAFLMYKKVTEQINYLKAEAKAKI